MNELIGKEVFELSRDIKLLLQKNLTGFSLGDCQLGILFELFKNQGITQDQVSRNRKLDKTTIAKAVGKLVKNGYIYKERDISDKRSFNLFLTEKGIDFKPTLEEIISIENNVLKDNITLEELKVFFKITRQMKINVEKYLDEVSNDK